MTKDLNHLAARMERLAGLVETSASRLAVAGVRAAVRELVYVTPVDTSEALSNWQVSLNAPPAVNIPPYYPGIKGSTRRSSAEQAINEAEAALTVKEPGQTLFLYNLTPYIKRLDEGSSSQFAGGFVPRALISFRVAVEEARKTLFS